MTVKVGLLWRNLERVYIRNAENNFDYSWAEIKESAERGCWMILCVYWCRILKVLRSHLTLPWRKLFILWTNWTGCQQWSCRLINCILSGTNVIWRSHWQTKGKRMSLVAEVNDCQSSKYEFDHERNERIFDRVRQFLSIIEEWCTNTKGSLSLCRAVAACYRLLSQENKSASVQISLDQFFKKVGKMLLGINISYFWGLISGLDGRNLNSYCWLNSCMNVGNCW